MICKAREGTIVTADGTVCDECMPSELLPTARTLNKSRLVIYRKTHPGWEPCASGRAGRPRTAERIGRSMAITQDGPVSLCDALNASISCAESIDMVVSFIRSSGVNLVIDALREAAEAGCRTRAIATAYMGATEYEAVEELANLPNAEVRMELTAGRSRLHAKSYLFTYPDGKGTAFIGSANLSRSALTSGEEWMVAIREEDLPAVVEDLRQAFERLWRSPDLTRVTKENRAEIERALERRGKREHEDRTGDRGQQDWVRPAQERHEPRHERGGGGERGLEGSGLHREVRPAFHSRELLQG